ncbi:transcriptional regulator family: Fungal Specific TF [Paecilomyces variotii]|nr:transcriptional regulator family: Fungal Specific TF [Paecilomyces variotii]KAJ9374063.1 transcriptional regulator family: Fungal Specific TF [Paecilomyces variotii]
MFGTLHWSPHGKEAEFIERPHGSSNLERNPACDRCRARKVKCRDLGNEGCTRCIRLGKTCTFSTGKHRGDHRIQKASINKHTPHQHSPGWLDSFPQPSASSSCKDTEHEEEEPEHKDMGKQPPMSSLPDPQDGDGDGNVNVNEMTFDLSFLANFDHESSDRGGEDSSRFALFSAISPSTQPDPEPSSITSMLGTLLSPPLSSEDESQYFSPVGHTHPQDPSNLFDICIPTPASLHTSTSTAFPSGLSGQPCGCLAAVVFAVEQFEASCHAGHRAELDSIVSYQKEAIKCCRAQLKCSSCIARRETLVLLVFMLEKIVAACGLVVGLYRVKDVQPHRPSSSLRVNGDGSLDLGLATSKADWRELLLGDYEISSPLEWEHLVRVLILLQLRAVMELLADVKSMESEVLGETLMASLTQAEIRLGELEKSIFIL